MSVTKDINELRKKIDRIDGELIGLLRERLQTAREIGRIKKMNDLPIIDPDRESSLGARLNALSDQDLLQKEFIGQLWQLILVESYRVQAEGAE